MTKKAFEQIKAGLEEALEYARADSLPMVWQPIETAPKDRLILVSDGRSVNIAKWSSLQLMEVRNGRAEEKFGFVIHNTYFIDARPSNWMPLPKPPEASE